MSNEENTQSTEQPEVSQSETSTPTIETVETPAPEAASKQNNIVANLLALKESNPKVFFGALGGIAVLLIVLMSSGGNPEVVSSEQAAKNLATGQRYALKSANAYDPSATIRLVSVPGAIAAYDDTEEADRNGACQHMPEGTPVTALDFSDAYGKKNAYVKVRIQTGECKATEPWPLAIDIRKLTYDTKLKLSIILE